MSVVLLVEDEPDLGLYEARILEALGHRVVRCSGGGIAFTGCPMLKERRCPLAEQADMILFSCRLFAPLRHHAYSGKHLLRAYRSHPQYGRLPMLVVSVGTLDGLEGAGPIRFMKKFEEPDAVINAVDELLGGARPDSPQNGTSEAGRPWSVDRPLQRVPPAGLEPALRPF